MENLYVTGLFALQEDDFKERLKEYSLNRLTSFLDSGKSCLDVLIEQGMGDNDTWANTTPNIYEDLYLPYTNKVKYIESEISIRQNEIDIVKKIQDDIIEQKNIIQKLLNFENYLGESLLLEFSSYRREDKYKNDNYISDGLNNTQLFNNAQNFIKAANKEIYKSAEYQHKIDCNLYNLLTINEFKPIVDYFKLGNWIRCLVDGKIYKLRLSSYEINFDDSNQISTTFSDIIDVNNSANNIMNILNQSVSMASSYNAVKKQAIKGENSNSELKQWEECGLDTSNIKLINDADNQTQIWDSHGVLLREYNSNEETYSDTQMKIINSTIAITDDNWNTTKTAIGKFYYKDPETGNLISTYGINGETVKGKILIGEALGLYNESNTLRFDNQGFSVTNGKNTVNINPNNESIFNISNIKNDELRDIFGVDNEGNLNLIGNITAESLNLAEGVNIDPSKVRNLASVATSGDYNDLLNTPQLSTVATTGSYNDLIDAPIGNGSNIKNIFSAFMPQVYGGICKEIFSDKSILNGIVINKNDIDDGIIVIWANDVCLINGIDFTLINHDNYYVVSTGNDYYEPKNITIQIWKVNKTSNNNNNNGFSYALCCGLSQSIVGQATDIEEV